MDSKRCAHCGQEKPLDEFHASKASPDGHTVICKACANAAAREHYQENKERYAEHFKRWAKEHRGANTARATVFRALRDGRLTRQPCEVCGDPNSVAHHEDYSKPLDVRWLCRSDHKQHHARLAESQVKALAAG